MEFPVVNRLYRIIKIHPACEWYAERRFFEGKLMRCIEVFEADDAAGFTFADQMDCPANYDNSLAFCLDKPVIKLEPQLSVQPS